MPIFFRHTIGFAMIICGAVFVSCTKKQNSGPVPLLTQKGRTVYQTTCIACHNPDPTKGGPLGPEVAGSSRELLEARIMTATYPPGYQPKRNTKSMAALPHLKDDIDALHAYLNNL